jgi:NAD(P)-dependent dehydrogenase (short-subunit alcohol dehydrogenase family)
MIPRGGGKIVNIGSNFGEIAFKSRSVYAAAKAGVHHMSRALSLEWASLGVSVNVVAPCITETPWDLTDG